MIENKLTFYELSEVLRPFLRLDSAETVHGALEKHLKLSIRSKSDIVCQDQLLLTFEGYRIDITDLHTFDNNRTSLIMQFRAPKRWWHGLAWDQNSSIVKQLKTVCQSEIEFLRFSKYETTGSSGLFQNETVELSYIHDASALNYDWKQGYDVSPLAIAPDSHDGKCFVQFCFNPLAYERTGKKTRLRENWDAYAFALSESIQSRAQARFGGRDNP